MKTDSQFSICNPKIDPYQQPISNLRPDATPDDNDRIETYVGVVGGKDGIKLEDQALITETGYENLTNCPFDEKLMG